MAGRAAFPSAFNPRIASSRSSTFSDPGFRIRSSA